VDTDSIAREIVEVNAEARKPIICNLMTDRRQWTETVRILQEGGVPCYGLPGTAARALAALAHYEANRARDIGEAARFDDVDKGRAAGILQEAGETGRKLLSASEAYQLLAAYGIPVAEWRMASNADEAVQAAAEIGFPVAIKADAESIVHKTDVGGVAVNLQDGEAVHAVVEEMTAKLAVDDLRFFVQKYLPDGLEVIVGAKAEEGLGHLVMFGIGGIYVEVLKDVVFKISPVTPVEVQEMLSSIKAAPLLKGVRGEQGVDEGAIAEIIQRVSQLVSELPEIQEMDLNPIIAYSDQAFVVDARISL
jgi:acetyltransferase